MPDSISREMFEALLLPNLQSMRAFVRTRLKIAAHEDDVVQQALLHAFAHRHQLSTPAKFKSWLWSIAMNEIRMFFRRQRAVTSIEDIPGFEYRDRAPSPLAAFEQLERRNWLDAGMAKLSARDRAAIRLRDLEGLSIEETAGVLARSQEAVKSTHFRARRRLASALTSA